MSAIAAVSRALRSNLIGEVALRVPQLAFDAWAARVLSPTEFGIWTAYRVLLQLTPYLPSIPTSGLDIRYSRLKGAEEHHEARVAAGAGLLLVIVATGLQLLVLAVGVRWPSFRLSVAPGSDVRDYVWFLAAVGLQGVYGFFVAHLRNQLHFNRVNSVLFLGNVASFLLLLLLADEFRVAGVVAAFAVNPLVCILFWWVSADLQLPRAARFGVEAPVLIRVGAPLLVVGLAFDSIRLLTRWVVGRDLGPEALGYFGVSYVFCGMVFMVGASASRVLLQFMARADGGRVNSPELIRQYYFAPTLGVTAIGALALSSVWLGAAAVLPRWAPAQVPALEILRPGLYGILFLTIVFLHMTLLRAQQRVGALVAGTAGAFACLAVLLGVASLMDATLWWYAVAEAASFALLLVILLGGQKVPRNSGKRTFLSAMLLTCALTVAGLELGVWLSRAAGSPALRMAIQLACVLAATACWAPVTWRAFQKLAGTSSSSLAPEPQLSTVR